jgi:tetratricopeptide (TPR) repeat protein
MATRDHQAGVDAAREAAACSDIGIQAMAYAYMGQNNFQLGKYEEAISQCRKAVGAAR